MGVKSHEEARGRVSRSAPFYLRQGCLSLREPERHLHRLVHLDPCRQLSTSLRPLADYGIQRAETPVAVRLERAHAQRLGQSQGLTVGGFDQLGLRGLAVRVDLAEEPQGPGLISLSCGHAAELQATHRDCQRLVEAAEAQIRLAQPDTDPPPYAPG